MGKFLTQEEERVGYVTPTGTVGAEDLPRAKATDSCSHRLAIFS